MARDTQPCGLVILPLAVAIRWRAGALTPTDNAVIEKAMRDPLGDSPEELVDAWVTVPAAPTLEMEVAFAEAWFAKRRPIDDIDMADAWKAAIGAAPVAPVEPTPAMADPESGCINPACRRKGLLSGAQPTCYLCGGAIKAPGAMREQVADAAAHAGGSAHAFARELIHGAYEGGTFDAGEIQDLAVKHGLLRIKQRREACGELCACAEYGFPAECLRPNQALDQSDTERDAARYRWLRSRPLDGNDPFWIAVHREDEFATRCWGMGGDEPALCDQAIDKAMAASGSAQP